MCQFLYILLSLCTSANKIHTNTYNAIFLSVLSLALINTNTATKTKTQANIQKHKYKQKQKTNDSFFRGHENVEIIERTTIASLLHFLSVCVFRLFAFSFLFFSFLHKFYFFPTCRNCVILCVVCFFFTIYSVNTFCFYFYLRPWHHNRC